MQTGIIWLTVELAGIQVSLRNSHSKNGTGLRDLHFDKLSERLIAYGITLEKKIILFDLILRILLYI